MSKTMESQNLKAFHFMSGITEIHAADCQHSTVKRGGEETLAGTYSSKEEFGLDYWSDINAETPDQPAYDWTEAELQFKPCVKIANVAETPVVARSPLAVRREARAKMYAAMMTAVAFAESDGDAELVKMMEAQAARVASLFGMK